MLEDARGHPSLSPNLVNLPYTPCCCCSQSRATTQAFLPLWFFPFNFEATPEVVDTPWRPLGPRGRGQDHPMSLVRVTAAAPLSSRAFLLLLLSSSSRCYYHRGFLPPQQLVQCCKLYHPLSLVTSIPRPDIVNPQTFASYLNWAETQKVK